MLKPRRSAPGFVWIPCLGILPLVNHLCFKQNSALPLLANSWAATGGQHNDLLLFSPPVHKCKAARGVCVKEFHCCTTCGGHRSQARTSVERCSPVSWEIRWVGQPVPNVIHIIHLVHLDYRRCLAHRVHLFADNHFSSCCSGVQPLDPATVRSIEL